MLQIKNNSLVVSNETTPKETTLIIKRENKDSSSGITKLSDVLDYIPNGIIYKDETGMGATTLEITSKRDSIIVQPLKITASSKAKKHHALYVGSETKYHPKTELNTSEDISIYDTIDEVPYKKIVVVADSLPKVIEALGEEVFKKYFLLIDEIDSFQLDSTFRDSMERCIDIFLKFPKDKRAILSATLIDFSNPHLKSEHVTTLGYDQAVKRNITLIRAKSGNIYGSLYDRIVSTINSHPGQKIFIALNSVTASVNQAESLINKEIVKPTDISILCSASSLEKAGKFYKQLESENLPSLVNFLTSAYYTGFDLLEHYHLISVVNNRSKYQVLSEKRLKQIAGRCRVGLLSETVIHDIAGEYDYSDMEDEDTLLETANELLASLTCIDYHFTKNSILQKLVGPLSDQLQKFLSEQRLKLIRKDEKDIYQISYFNIDARLESIRTRRDLYSEEATLANALIKEGHMVSIKESWSDTDIEDIKTSQVQRDKEVNEIIDQLKSAKVSSDVDFILLKDEDYWSRLQLAIAYKYKKLVRYVDAESTLEKLRDSLIGKRDLREFNRIALSAEFSTYDEGTLLISRLNAFFPVGCSLTPEEIRDKMNLYLSEMQILETFSKPAAAVRFLKTFKTVKRSPDAKGVPHYKIKGDNPYKINVLQYRRSGATTDVMSALRSMIN
jgi:hypothetical protein